MAFKINASGRMGLMDNDLRWAMFGLTPPRVYEPPDSGGEANMAAQPRFLAGIDPPRQFYIPPAAAEVAPTEAAGEVPNILVDPTEGGTYYFDESGKRFFTEPTRPEGRATWTQAQTNAWVAAHLTTPPPMGVPGSAIWDPERGDWYLTGTDRENLESREYLNRGQNWLAANYVGGTYVGPGSTQVTTDRFGNRTIGIPYRVPRTSIGGTLRPGDTGYVVPSSINPNPPVGPIRMTIAPQRPLGVPESYVWDSNRRTWTPPLDPRYIGRRLPGSTTSTAAPRQMAPTYPATPPGEQAPLGVYNHNQDGSMSVPGQAAPVDQWSLNSDSPAQPTDMDWRTGMADYVNGRMV